MTNVGFYNNMPYEITGEVCKSNFNLKLHYVKKNEKTG